MVDNNKSIGRKDRILNAALKIFAERGFQNSTIVEISKEAEVSEATVYEYFGTKEDVYFHQRFRQLNRVSSVQC